jgi:hypothetical protein
MPRLRHTVEQILAKLRKETRGKGCGLIRGRSRRGRVRHPSLHAGNKHSSRFSVDASGSDNSPNSTPKTAFSVHLTTAQGTYTAA